MSNLLRHVQRPVELPQHSFKVPYFGVDMIFSDNIHICYSFATNISYSTYIICFTSQARCGLLWCGYDQGPTRTKAHLLSLCGRRMYKGIDLSNKAIFLALRFTLEHINIETF